MKIKDRDLFGFPLALASSSANSMIFAREINTLRGFQCFRRALSKVTFAYRGKRTQANGCGDS
jgi:hypothetical protein